MAVLIFTAAAGAAGWGPVATALATAAGSYIDAAYVIPTLFPPEQPDRPRAGDVARSGSDEGTPIPFAVGPTVRVTGAHIWLSKIYSEKYRHDAGGKGGGGGEVIEYADFIDVAVGICRGPITRVLKIWANGTTIYDVNPDVSVTSSALSVSIFTTYIHQAAPPSGTIANPAPPYSGPTVVDKEYMDVRSPAGAVDLSTFKPGADIQSSGWTNAGNNGTFRCVKSWTDATTGDTYVRLINALAVAESAGAVVTLFQNLPEFKLTVADDMTFYLGTPTQTADSVIEIYEGVGNVPAFRDIAYVVISKLALKDFGMLPSFEFLVEVTTTRTVGEAISDIALFGGLTAADIDVSAVTTALKGYSFDGPQPPSQMLQPLMIVYDVLVQHDELKLRFFPRTSALEIAVLPGDLAAHEYGGEAPRRVAVRDSSPIDLPAKTTVKYVDPASDYIVAAQTYRRNDDSGGGAGHANLTSVLSASEALSLAKRLTWTAHVNSRRVSIQLPPSYLRLREGDVATFSVDGVDWRILLQRVEIGANFLVIAEGILEEPGVLDFTAAESETEASLGAGAGAPGVEAPADFDIAVIDLAPLRAMHADEVGIYVAAALWDPRIMYRGGNLYESVDSTTFQFLQTIPTEASIGFAETVLPTVADPFSWDRVSTVDVRLEHGSPATCTELELLNGVNRFLVGTEIIGAQTVTSIGTDKYRLSGKILRGLCNTEAYVASHVVGERVVHLNPVGVLWHPMQPSAMGTVREYMAVPLGGVIPDFQVGLVQHQVVGATVRPFSPAAVKATRNASNDATITWLRRTRNIVRLLSPQGAPDVEPVERYNLYLYAKTPSGYTTVSKVYQITNTAGDGINSQVISAADQSAAGYTPGPTELLKIRLGQIGLTFGLGNLIEITL